MTVMRPEVRAEYARALEHVAGDEAFGGPLRALLHRAARSAVRGLRCRSALRRAVAGTARRDSPRGLGARSCAAPPRPRARDNPRLASPGAGGRVRHLRRPLRRHAGGGAGAPSVPARAGGELSAPDAVAARAARAQRRRLCRRGLRGRAGRARHDGRSPRAGVGPPRPRDGALHRRGWSTTRRASIPGRRVPSAATRGCSSST